MTNQVGATLRDIIVSLAQGIQEAQETLSLGEPFDEFGRPRPQYHLPHLDFELKVSSVETEQREPAQQNTVRSASYIAPNEMQRLGMARADSLSTQMAFAIAGPAVSSSQNNSIHSTISGRFVSIPPNEGMPQLVIALTSAASTPRASDINARVSFASGPIAKGVQVEFNIDQVATAALNGVALPASGSLIDPVVALSSGAQVVGPTGIVSTTFDFSQVDISITEVRIMVSVGVFMTSLIVGR